MQLDPGEVQILRGPRLSVTDRRIVHDANEVDVARVTAPQIEAVKKSVSAAPAMLTIALIFFAFGAFTRTPMLWIAGLALGAFGFTAKINRNAFAVTVETAGARMPIYVTAHENEAKLALAAVLEAQRRTGA